MPIGFPETEPFTQVVVPFCMGDFFFFYSDGLSEAMDSQGRLFGEERLVKSVKASSGFSPYEIINRVWTDTVTFSGTETFRDDFTCVVVKIDPPDSVTSQPDAESRMTFSSDLKELYGIRQFISFEIFAKPFLKHCWAKPE